MNYKKYVWYKVWYKFTAKYDGETYITFELAMNNDNNPNYVDNVIKKYGDNFVKVTKWMED